MRERSGGSHGEADIQDLLTRAADGDEEANAALFSALYSSLYTRAAALMRRQPRAHSLQATALVHEAYLKIQRGRSWKDRQHLILTAARAMRHILVDHARRRSLQGARAEDEFEVFDQVAIEYGGRARDLDALHGALEKLATFDEEAVRIVELRFFAGKSMREIAELMSIKKRTLERKWMFTKAWLYREASIE